MIALIVPMIFLVKSMSVWIAVMKDYNGITATSAERKTLTAYGK